MEECGFHPPTVLEDPLVQYKFLLKRQILVFYKTKDFWYVSFQKGDLRKWKIPK